MPGGNGTGPLGLGPMTGRGAGFCAGYRMPGYASSGGGRGAYGRGSGFRNMYYATGLPGWMRYGGNYGNAQYTLQMSREAELKMLKDQADYFKGALEDINKKLTEIESGGE